jgi:hypothetical protein
MIKKRGIYKQTRDRHGHHSAKPYLDDNEQVSHKGLQTT